MHLLWQATALARLNNSQMHVQVDNNRNREPAVQFTSNIHHLTCTFTGSLEFSSGGWRYRLSWRFYFQSEHITTFTTAA